MKNRHSPFYALDRHRLRAHHKVTLFGGLLSLCLSIASASTLMNLTYFADAFYAFSDGVFFIGGGVACAVFGIAQSIVIHGYPQWVWLQAGVFTMYLVLVIPTAIYSPDHVLFTLALLSLLVGLLCLNSKRQREMRRTMLETRHRRRHR